MTKEEYEISCEGLSHCPQHKYGKKRWGEKGYFHCVCKDQLHDTIGESCFLFCDVDSDHTCGECVHWLGHVTHDGKRHEKSGSCFHRIGGVGASSFIGSTLRTLPVNIMILTNSSIVGILEPSKSACSESLDIPNRGANDITLMPA